MEGEKEGEKEDEKRRGYTTRRERARVCVRMCICMCRETRPIVIAIPTGGMFLRCAVSYRPATKPERTHPTVRSRPSNGATGCTTFHLPSCLPPYIHTTYIRAAHGCTFFVPERLNEKRGRERERKSMLNYTGSTVYEKCSTRIAGEKRSRAIRRDLKIVGTCENKERNIYLTLRHRVYISPYFSLIRKKCKRFYRI